MNRLGQLILYVSVALLGYTLKQNNSYMLQYKNNLENYLSQTSLEIETAHIEKSYKIMTNLMMYTPLGIIGGMDIVCVLSGFALLFLNFVMNFKVVYGELEEKFFFLTLIAFGVLICGFLSKKK